MFHEQHEDKMEVEQPVANSDGLFTSFFPQPSSTSSANAFGNSSSGAFHLGQHQHSGTMNSQGFQLIPSDPRTHIFKNSPGTLFGAPSANSSPSLLFAPHALYNPQFRANAFPTPASPTSPNEQDVFLSNQRSPFVLQPQRQTQDDINLHAQVQRMTVSPSFQQQRFNLHAPRFLQLPPPSQIQADLQFGNVSDNMDIME